ncbi:Pentachlorophenol 4-monooxygenase [Hypsizygus marmoreus]|uniref:Pentachlorophenol 4-monooxygenase n=1 Tax=Hypsizygus marmoreus TaxID=39966 RepID=A0A369JZW2_HYPMA|nr:Pentachlorophenol 4-monooxygenase [Hypsizygus marmoreus]
MSSILIVGAGLSGLMLALALLCNGISIRIIEKEQRYVIGQRGCGIQPRTLEIQQFLGILPDILGLARLAPSLQLHSSPEGSTSLMTLELNQTMDNTTFYPYINPLILGQDTHEGILRSHLQKDYNCIVELGTQFVAFEQHLNDVTVQISKLNDGIEVPETATFNWVIDADGAHSTVQKQLDLEFLGVTRESEILVVGDIHVKDRFRDRKYWLFWGNDYSKKLMAMPPFETEDGRYNFMVGGAELDHTKIASSCEELIKVFQEVSGRTDVEFSDLIWMGIWRPNIRMTKSFGEGSIFVVGDTGHVHTPGGGQGMNSGIQDSFNLAWKLALVKKGISPMSILETYTEERLSIIESMLANTTLGVNYRGSSLVIDEIHLAVENSDPYHSRNDGTIRAGDRAPEALALLPLRSPHILTNLFDTFRPSLHSIVIFSDAANEQSDSLKSVIPYTKGVVQTIVIYPQSTSPAIVPELADYVFVDQGRFAYKHYNVVGPNTEFVVVRPDGYIGALAGGIDGLTHYFKGIFL